MRNFLLCHSGGARPSNAAQSELQDLAPISSIVASHEALT